MIDVLLVILIFLVITTTYSKFSALEINLPQAASGNTSDRHEIIDVAVSVSGSYMVNGTPVQNPTTEQLSKDLRTAADGRPDPVIVVNADAAATHQSVITVMEAARLAGYNHITFMTQKPE